MYSKVTRKGFTLTELMAVVIIVSILAGIAIGSYKKSVERSHFTEGLIAGATVAEAVIRYRYDNDASSGVRPKASQLDVGFANDRACTLASEKDYCFKTRYFEITIYANRIQVNRVQDNRRKDYYFFFYPTERSEEVCGALTELGSDLCKSMGYTSCVGSGTSTLCRKP